eukprot:IDg6296t1
MQAKERLEIPPTTRTCQSTQYDAGYQQWGHGVAIAGGAAARFWPCNDRHHSKYVRHAKRNIEKHAASDRKGKWADSGASRRLLTIMDNTEAHMEVRMRTAFALWSRRRPSAIVEVVPAEGLGLKGE